ncbi:hypothetical protein I6A84_07400 [Frankia sp. CNm7]|uniref:Uncharacterized protein n=1 Tax=Frankia nepalensis TaxID=1836974 RepID=A0A937RNS7_9ACTN|nr:hypothetical protein [Frankia nepalensis]MBL7502732.1 hypothetical protein [Frankia nepalensis]MBL7515106.1 hypothetical protein [Frankia nepalensis]MBL7517951.1 hypothetical protein [Frankia nepalensis]MBL7629231.1 hypothetical protein [Frankia nepalensis]
MQRVGISSASATRLSLVWSEFGFAPSMITPSLTGAPVALAIGAQEVRSRSLSWSSCASELPPQVDTKARLAGEKGDAGQP